MQIFNYNVTVQLCYVNATLSFMVAFLGPGSFTPSSGNFRY